MVKYRLALRDSLISLSTTLLIDFTKALLITSRRKRFPLVCVDHITGRPIACSTTTATFSQVTALMRQYVVLSFGSPRVAISDSSLCFTARELEQFMIKYGTKQKNLMTSDLMSSLRGKAMFQTILRAVSKVVLRRHFSWVLAVPRVLCGFRFRSLASQLSWYDFLYEENLREPLEHLEASREKLFSLTY